MDRAGDVPAGQGRRTWSRRADRHARGDDRGGERRRAGDVVARLPRPQGARGPDPARGAEVSVGTLLGLRQRDDEDLAWPDPVVLDLRVRLAQGDQADAELLSDELHGLGALNDIGLDLA